VDTSRMATSGAARFGFRRRIGGSRSSGGAKSIVQPEIANTPNSKVRKRNLIRKFYASLTSAISFVNEDFASPKSIEVFGW
jgi:hypothetical protein